MFDKQRLDRRRQQVDRLLHDVLLLRDPPDKEPSASFAMLFVVSMIGIVCHILMDFPTSYGTRPLSPFSWNWFAADLMPIVDLYLIAALFAGLLFGQMSEASRRRNAAIV